MISEDYKMMPDSYDEDKDLAYSSGKLFETEIILENPKLISKRI